MALWGFNRGLCRILDGKARGILRPFSCTATKLATGASAPQHTYFRHDSPVIHFPEHSNYAEQSHPYRHERSHPAHALPDGEKWLIFIGGFLTFPLVCAGYWYGNWAVGSKLWKSEVKDLEDKGLAEGSRGLLKDSQDQFMEANNLYNILQRANAETKALHDLVLLFLDPGTGLHSKRDTALLHEYPIKMSDGKKLDPKQAIVVRILDKDEKTVVLILGVDMSGHSSSESDPALSWCHDYALRSWMDERAEHLKERGEESDSHLGLYCYTATSSATSLPGSKGKMWQEARLFPEDLPSGFPLSMLDQVKDEITGRVP